MNALSANRWIANHVISLTAVVFYAVHLQINDIQSSFWNYLPPYGITFLGYHFIRKIDDKVSHETSTIEYISLITSGLFLVPIFSDFPSQPIKWIAAIVALLLSILYIYPLGNFRLRNYALTKSISISITWIIIFLIVLYPNSQPPKWEYNQIFYLYSTILLLVSCWVYDIQESDWSSEKIRLVKGISIAFLSILFFLHPAVEPIKKGMVGLLLLSFAFHITKLQKCYHPRQNVWIDIFLGLNLSSFLL